MSPGLTIQGTTLPVALLSNHCEQFLLMSAQSLATVTQPQAVELQITATQQHTENIHPLIQLSDGKRQTQAEHIGGGGLRFNLSVQNRLEQVDRQKGLGKTRSQHLHIHGVGEVAKASFIRLIHCMKPMQQRIRLIGHQLILRQGRPCGCSN